jgi:hypothetical protein
MAYASDGPCDHVTAARGSFGRLDSQEEQQAATHVFLHKVDDRGSPDTDPAADPLGSDHMADLSATATLPIPPFEMRQLVGPTDEADVSKIGR